MRLNFKNNAYTTLAESINNTATSFTVVDASLLPEPPFLLTILDSDVKHGTPVEIVEVGAVNGNILSDVLRGQEGTQAVSHNTGVRLENRLTAGAVGEAADAGEFDSHLSDYTTQIALIKDKIGIAPFIKSWEDVQAIVRAGLAEEYFEIGDQFLSMYDGRIIVWDIIGIDHDTPTDTNYTHSMTIQTRDCLDNIMFDAPEPTNPDTNRQQYGNNRYIHSAIRQWLNSNDDVFQWVPQHEYDAAPTGAIYEGPGFLKLLDPELVAVIGAVDKQVARNTVTDAGGQDTFSDKVFLLSRLEVYGDTEGDTTGEEPYVYYSALAGAPTTDPLAGRIKLLNGSPRYWWLRSPHVGDSSIARNVHPTGSVSNNYANYAFGLSPACCII